MFALYLHTKVERKGKLFFVFENEKFSKKENFRWKNAMETFLKTIYNNEKFYYYKERWQRCAL